MLSSAIYFDHLRAVWKLKELRDHAGIRDAHICTAGVRPSKSDGASLTESSNGELLHAKRCANAARPPAAGGRSLTALLAVLGGPAWDMAVAPVIRWANAVWQAAAYRKVTGIVPTDALNKAWSSAAKQWPTVCVHCRGAIGAAHLRLQRLG